MKRIGVVDFGLGNLFSVQQALHEAGAESTLVAAPSEIHSFDGLVLPGVGAFGEAMKELRERKLDVSIRQWAEDKKPLLGVCLGLQLLMDSSEEFGSHQGLGLVAGQVKKFPAQLNGNPLRVPHMGWAEIEHSLKDHPALHGIANRTDMYFVHSYYVELGRPEAELTSTHYAGLKYTSSIVKDNIWAFQFHPEKSAAPGLRIYQNWVDHIS